MNTQRDPKPANDVLDTFSFKVDRIVSDGQSGAARGAIHAARELGLQFGGWCSADGLADDAARVAQIYGMHPCRGGFGERCAHNLRYSQGTLLLSFCDDDNIDGRTAHARDFAKKKRKASAHLQLTAGREPGPKMVNSLRGWLGRYRIRTLHVTGPLESKEPGICEAVKALLVATLRVEGAP